MKIHVSNPLWVKLVDKYAVKKWVEQHCPDVKIIPTIGVWEHFDEIDFDKLPNQFVLKCTHDSGGLVICKDKMKLNKEKAKAKIEKSLQRKFYLFCFNGVPKMFFIATDRPHHTCFDFYDMDFNHLPFKNGHPWQKKPIKKPEHFEKMIEYARQLSQGFPFVRVDFYNINGDIYFGELTFFHNAGMVAFDPEEWDYKIGEWLDLPKANK